MREEEFRDELPLVTFCDACGAQLGGIAWNVAQFGRGQWFGLGIAKCEPCSRVKVAAAGSTETAHQYAKSVRAKFVGSMKW